MANFLSKIFNEDARKIKQIEKESNQYWIKKKNIRIKPMKN